MLIMKRLEKIERGQWSDHVIPRSGGTLDGPAGGDAFDFPMDEKNLFSTPMTLMRFQIVSQVAQSWIAQICHVIRPWSKLRGSFCAKHQHLQTSPRVVNRMKSYCSAVPLIFYRHNTSGRSEHVPSFGTSKATAAQPRSRGLAASVCP